jgi:anti-sigma factor ChrR (cupin superfamily)
MSVPSSAQGALTPSPYRPIVLPNLSTIAEWQHQLDWQPFRPGVDIHRLYGDGITGNSAALLRYQEEALVPLHRHVGYEHILVLSGSQRDQNQIAEAGTLVINPPGTAHSVMSQAGCIVLAIYSMPVQFIEPGA